MATNKNKTEIVDATVKQKKNASGEKRQNPRKGGESKTRAGKIPGGKSPGGGKSPDGKSPGGKSPGGTGKRRSGRNQGAGRNAEPVRIAFLGGLNEVGKNITLYEYKDDMFIVDCGLAFPDQDMLGVDLVIPDFSYVEQNKDKIRGIMITHGHEDHIGALPYLLKTVNAPVFGTVLTIGLIKAKLREHGLANVADLNVINPGDKVFFGEFEVECIHVNHSIPGAISLAIRCEAGVMVQTGDFKIDSTPIDGEMIDLSRFAQIGQEGVLCLLSDSTNAERPGFTESERKVGESFETLFLRAENRRLIVATFASNIHRVQQILNVAQRLGRKVAMSGRSLENVVSISNELGCLHVPDGLVVNIDAVNKYPADKMVIITTGSQGEPLSALARMAFSEHRKVEICPNDCVIISATPIPGNEKTVGKVINELMKLGAEVIYEKMYDVHVSGHACQEELKILMGILKPKYFIPVHGEQKHLTKHAGLAKSMGIPGSNIMIADNGNVIELTSDSINFGASVTAGRVFVDGYGVGDVGNVVLRDRRRLAQDGLVIVAATLDSATGQLVSGPDIVSRGFVYERESEELIEDAKRAALQAIEESMSGRSRDTGAMKAKIRDVMSRLMYERTKRSPMVIPVILEI
ncbi:MAG: ribonuclease J [Oscillospiraceae bacterium]|nr:ribonuclease J [Oscillospiraceae bacterium]